MSDAISLQFRGIVMEDLMYSFTNGQVPAPVLGIGTVQVTPFVAAADDQSASQAGVLVGQVYLCNAGVPLYLRTRMA